MVRKQIKIYRALIDDLRLHQRRKMCIPPHVLLIRLNYGRIIIELLFLSAQASIDLNGGKRSILSSLILVLGCAQSCHVIAHVARRKDGVAQGEALADFRGYVRTFYIRACILSRHEVSPDRLGLESLRILCQEHFCQFGLSGREST